MRDGTPDPDLFDDTVGGIISRTDRAGHGMRIFGEMVALLVAQGNPDAALRLEELWNRLQTQYPFPLLCGYRMEEMRGEALAAVLVGACAEHSFVVPAESYSELDGTDARLRAIAQLQQKAASLEREVAERRVAEENLQRSLAAEQLAPTEAEAALRLRDKLSRLVNQLLDISRLNGGRLQLDPAPTDLVTARTAARWRLW